jgi:lysozyme
MIKKLLILHEALRLEPYLCSAKKWTIGVGYNYQAHGFDTDTLTRILREGFSQELALELLGRQIEETRFLLTQDFYWFTTLDSVRQAVLIDMAYNMGVPGLKKFHRTLNAFRDKRWEEAVTEMFNSKWAFQVGDGPGKREDRADRLARMVRTGRWPDEILT